MSTALACSSARLARTSAVASLAFVLAACAHPDALRVGMTTSELDARFGRPSVERHEGADDIRIYTSQPLGERASAAHVGPDGRVVAIEPLLNTQHFATIRVGWSKRDVFDHFGPPAEITGTRQYVVWSYRYRESEVWYSLFSVMFDASGIVQKTENGPDPMFDPSFKNRF